MTIPKITVEKITKIKYLTIAKTKQINLIISKSRLTTIIHLPITLEIKTLK